MHRRHGLPSRWEWLELKDLECTDTFAMEMGEEGEQIWARICSENTQDEYYRIRRCTSGGYITLGLAKLSPISEQFIGRGRSAS